MQKSKYGPENPDITYVSHKYDEHLYDTGDAVINYATTGSPDRPAIVLIPGKLNHGGDMKKPWGYCPTTSRCLRSIYVVRVDRVGRPDVTRTIISQR